jgi:hypothetical protein
MLYYYLSGVVGCLDREYRILLAKIYGGQVLCSSKEIESLKEELRKTEQKLRFAEKFSKKGVLYVTGEWLQEHGLTGNGTASKNEVDSKIINE